jgi:hypothetical protein
MANRESFPVFSVVYNVLAIPYNFMSGFIVGLAAPIAAIAAMVAGVRLLTGKVPFLGTLEDTEGERRIALTLVPEGEVGPLFEEQKEKIGGDLAKMQAEIKAIIEEARIEVEVPPEE